MPLALLNSLETLSNFPLIYLQLVVNKVDLLHETSIAFHTRLPLTFVNNYTIQLDWDTGYADKFIKQELGYLNNLLNRNMT